MMIAIKRIRTFLVGLMVVALPIPSAGADWKHGLQNRFQVPTVGKETIMRPTLKAILATIATGLCVDDGCSNGDLTVELDRIPGVTRVVGVDPSETAIRFAQTRTDAEDLRTGVARKVPLEWHVKRHDVIPLADATVQTITCINVLPVLPTVAAVDTLLAEQYRVLSPGGHLVLVWIDEAFVRANTNSPNFGATMTDDGTPISYAIRLKQIDGGELAFDDHCWPTRIVKQRVQAAGFSLVEDILPVAASPDSGVAPYRFLVVAKPILPTSSATF